LSNPNQDLWIFVKPESMRIFEIPFTGQEAENAKIIMVRAAKEFGCRGISSDSQARPGKIAA